MSPSDKRISAAIATIILIHVTVLALGLKIPAFSFLIALINLLVSSSILIYWTQKQIRITQHFLELREILVLLFEVIVLGCAGYSLFIHHPIQWLTIVNLSVLGIHLLVLLAFFVFMLTFKMKKLF